MSKRMFTARRSTFALFTGALVLGSATACSLPSTPTVTSVKSTSAGGSGSSTGKSTGGKAKAKAAQVGDTISLKGMEGESADVTVVKLVADPQGADQYTTPDSGKRFYAVQFRIKDTGSAGYSDSPSNGAAVVDSQGQVYQADGVDDTTAGSSFPAALNIADGDSALGFITFQVPTGAKIVKIQFGLDSGMADQTGQWNVN